MISARNALLGQNASSLAGMGTRGVVQTLVSHSENSTATEWGPHAGYMTLTSLRDYRHVGNVDIGALDTVILPVRDDDSSRRQVLVHHQYGPVSLNLEKLHHLQYAAFCIGSPTGAITHYAAIRSYAATTGELRGNMLYFAPPEYLGHALEWREGGCLRLRRPRYTSLAMLLEAKSIEELFGQ